MVRCGTSALDSLCLQFLKEVCVGVRVCRPRRRASRAVAQRPEAALRRREGCEGQRERALPAEGNEGKTVHDYCE